MQKKTNILLFQRLIPHYRVSLFKKLNEKLGIVVCHSKAKKGASLQEQQELGFQNEVLPRMYFDKSPTTMLQRIYPALQKYKPSIVITEFSLSYVTFWCLLFFKMFFKYELVVWTHGVKSKEMLKPFSSWRSKIQLWEYNRADAVILYSKKRKDLLAQHVNKPDKLFLANNTLDTDELNRIYNKLQAKGKDTIKEKLGYQYKQNIVFIGRLVSEKRLDLLLKAFTSLESKSDLGLHIIGSGSEEELVNAFSKEHKNIFYHGPIHDLLLSSKYLFAADLMMMPGYVGLSVVHAMSMGCPVLTCKQGPEGPFHSPEVEYIHDGINGCFCDNSVKGLKNAMTRLLSNKDKLADMSIKASETIANEANVGQFISGFRNAINYVTT